MIPTIEEFRKSCWSLSPISIALKVHIGKISAISSHNFKRHVKVRLRSKVMVQQHKDCMEAREETEGKSGRVDQGR